MKYNMKQNFSDTLNIQYLLWSVNTGKIGQVMLSFGSKIVARWLNFDNSKKSDTMVINNSVFQVFCNNIQIDNEFMKGIYTDPHMNLLCAKGASLFIPKILR